MTSLDAAALTDDPHGLRFLGAVIGPMPAPAWMPVSFHDPLTAVRHEPIIRLADVSARLSAARSRAASPVALSRETSDAA